MHVSDEKAFFSLVKAAFGQRRKTAANAISAGIGLPKAEVEEALAEAGAQRSARAEQLTMEQLAFMAEYLSNK